MKFSESWLREWVNPDIGVHQLVDEITMAGLEVDAVEAVAGEFSKVIVGEIISVQPHPDADKLRVCQVAGAPEGELQVVCGAPNARTGIKVPFALIGAELPPGEDGKKFSIKKSKLRGVESFGMLCGQTELQVGDDDSGLWELPLDAPTGNDLRQYLGLNDNIIDVDLTPNRSDCLSIKGLAREVGVLNRMAVNMPPIDSVAPASTDIFPVELKAVEACPRYVGRVIKNIDISQPSPLWLQEKLRRSGLRPKDAVVDITNYILLELGQPMHAFDLAKLKKGIQVRMAEQGEKITLLDDQEVELNSDTLVIADQSRAIAMAGIMGGKSTAVSTRTVDIFLESAFFNPLAIAGRARSYSLHTDSSHRFERGVDYEGAQAAVERATRLLVDIVGGEPGPTVVVENEQNIPPKRSVALSKAQISKGLGFPIPDADVEDILTRLGLAIESRTDDGWTFSIPSYRFDIAIEADLLEELARIYGYNRLPNTSLVMSITLPRKTEKKLSATSLADHMVTRDYQEAVTYSFIDPKIHALFEPGLKGVELLNPISADMSVMRTSLVPGLVQTLRYNINRQAQRVRLFEIGMVFIPGEVGLIQRQSIAGLIYGRRHAVAWNADKQEADFYDIKGDLESLFDMTGQKAVFEVGMHNALHPGQTARVHIGGKEVGYIGALHPQVLQELDIAKPAYVFEVQLSALLGAVVPKFSPLSKFPEISRDLAIVVDKNVNIAELETEISVNAGDYLKNLKVFDVYSGEGIDPQRKSVAFSLTYQHPSRTLNEDEISASEARILKRLEAEFNARLR